VAAEMAAEIVSHPFFELSYVSYLHELSSGMRSNIEAGEPSRISVGLFLQ
jgi:hypothetical protein